MLNVLFVHCSVIDIAIDISTLLNEQMVSFLIVVFMTLMKYSPTNHYCKNCYCSCFVNFCNIILLLKLPPPCPTKNFEILLSTKNRICLAIHVNGNFYCSSICQMFGRAISIYVCNSCIFLSYYFVPR